MSDIEIGFLVALAVIVGLVFAVKKYRASKGGSRSGGGDSNTRQH